MEVIVSAIVCIGVCMGLVCRCKMNHIRYHRVWDCTTRSKWVLHHMSKAQWELYFNEGGDL